MIRTIYHQYKFVSRNRKCYKDNRQYFGEKYASICKKLNKAEKRKAYSKIVELKNDKDEFIFNYLKKYIRNKNNDFYVQNECLTSSDNKSNIWVFWWTGFETAPDVVKVCVESIKRNAGKHKVILLDKDNYSKYIQIPEHVRIKHDQGIIGHAHFSDVVRLSLLSKYGGAWLDATLFISKEIPDYVFEHFYTCKSYSEDSLFISKSKWTTFFLAGNREFPLFSFARDTLVNYWENNDKAIDYLFMDYVFEMACRENSYISSVISSMPDNNLKRNDLMSLLNEPFNKEVLEDLFSDDTFVFKLSWRYGKLRTKDENGNMTNYGYLVKEYIK